MAQFLNIISLDKEFLVARVFVICFLISAFWRCTTAFRPLLLWENRFKSDFWSFENSTSSFSDALKVFSLFLIFCVLTMMCQGVVSFYLTYLRFTELLESVGLCPLSVWGKSFAIISSKLFHPILFLIYFWDSNWMYVRPCDIVPHISHAMFLLFYLCVFWFG